MGAKVNTVSVVNRRCPQDYAADVAIGEDAVQRVHHTGPGDVALRDLVEGWSKDSTQSWVWNQSVGPVESSHFHMTDARGATYRPTKRISWRPEENLERRTHWCGWKLGRQQHDTIRNSDAT